MPDIPLLRRAQERWVTIIYFVLAGIIAASWSSRIPDIQQKLRLNDAAWGTVLFALPVGFIAGITFASWFAVKYGTRIIMLTGCILASLLLFLLGLAENAVQLMIILFLVGFVRTVFNISLNTHSVEVQKLYEKPIISMFHGLWSLACLVAAGIGTWMIIHEINPATHFFMIGGSCAIIGILSIRLSKNRHQHTIDKRPLFVKPDKFLLILGSISFCVMLCESTMFDWSVNYFEKVVKPGKEYITTGFKAFIITMAVGRLAGDYFIGRFGPLAMIRINGTMITVGFLTAAIFPFFIPATIGLLLIGLGDSIIVPLAYKLSAKNDKMSASYAIAAVTMIGYIGFLTGPVLVGLISDAFGMQWAFAVVGIICFGIIILSGMLKPYLND